MTPACSPDKPRELPDVFPLRVRRVRTAEQLRAWRTRRTLSGTGDLSRARKGDYALETWNLAHVHVVSSLWGNTENSARTIWTTDHAADIAESLVLSNPGPDAKAIP